VDARCCSLTVSEDDVRGKKEFVVLEKGKRNLLFVAEDPEASQSRKIRECRMCG
jgi:hypothetical protein